LVAKSREVAAVTQALPPEFRCPSIFFPPTRNAMMDHSQKVRLAGWTEQSSGRKRSQQRMPRRRATASASMVVAASLNIADNPDDCLRDGVRFWSGATGTTSPSSVRTTGAVELSSEYPAKRVSTRLDRFCDCKIKAAARRRWKPSASKTGLSLSPVTSLTPNLCCDNYCR